MGKIKEETWTLNSADTVSIPSANRSDGTVSVWSDIWKYQIPSGQSHILKAAHRFSAYLEDGSAEVGSGTCQIRIEIRDQSENDRKVIYGPSLYIASKEFQDDDLMAKLGLKEDTVVEEKWFIVVVVKDDGAFDESDSYFKLETTRIRAGL